MRRVDWTGPGHLAPVDCLAEHVARLVAEKGELGALDALDEARAVAVRLAIEATERGHHRTADGLRAAADRLWAQTLVLTELYS